MKIYKATTDDGYVSPYKVYTGQDPQYPGLDKPGSIVIQFCEKILGKGRIIIALSALHKCPIGGIFASP